MPGIFSKKWKHCTEQTTGTVTSIISKNLDSPTMVTVCYSVNDIDYELKDSLKLKSELIKVGKIPIGQKKTRKMPVEIGSMVTVLYDPNLPSRAYLPDNTGIMNI